VGSVVDRRFGENDPTMAPEDRMLERFTKERQRASRGSAFNLEDEDELMHYGQSLSKYDDFDNADLALDEDDEEDVGQIDQRTVRSTHFGGFDDDESYDGEVCPIMLPDQQCLIEKQLQQPKSKAEVMAEVIAKSKEHKVSIRLCAMEEEND
jgi:nucleolar protein 14